MKAATPTIVWRLHGQDQPGELPDAATLRAVGGSLVVGGRFAVHAETSEAWQDTTYPWRLIKLDGADGLSEPIDEFRTLRSAVREATRLWRDGVRTCPEAVCLREAATAWARHQPTDADDTKSASLDRALRAAAVAYGRVHGY